MDIYKVIRESKEGKLFTKEEVNKLYSFVNDAILLRLVSNTEDEKISEMATIILKNKNEYWEAKHNDNLDDFIKDLISEIKNSIKHDRFEIKEKLFNKMDEIAKSMSQEINVSSEPTSDNAILFKLFLNEYNSKFAFTWKQFKKFKRDYEKNHPIENEDIYTLKSLLEKDPNITKVENNTVFCKSANTLSDKIIDKIKQKAV